MSGQSRIKAPIGLRAPVSLALPPRFDGHGVRHFSAPPPRALPLQIDGFSGRVATGASCNASVITLTPHCDGTHTECVGHLTRDPLDVATIAPRGFLQALVVSVTPTVAAQTVETSDPVPQRDDQLITAQALREATAAIGFHDSDEPWVEALVVRTLPNDAAKRQRDYSQGVPPYFSVEAANWIVKRGIAHWVVDLPSVDRTRDDGRLTAHRAFFGLPAASQEADDASRGDCTITELAFIPDDVADGGYLLQLGVAPLAGDAMISAPLLFRVLD